MIGTVIIHSIALILLFLISLKAVEPQQEEGILVNFGLDDTGYGMIEPSQPASAQEAYVPPSTTKHAANPSEEDPVLTQDFEDAPVVKKTDPEAERKKREEMEAEKIRKAEQEAERIRKEQEEVERKRIEAEKKRQADIINRTKNAFANSKNVGTSSTSEGVAGGVGNQGSPTGSVNSKNRGEGSGLGNSGVSYNLEGRGYQSLPLPEYKYQGEGRVVVEVSVDRSGKVIQANPGVKGSNTLDEYLLKAAKEAALRARFDANPNAAVVQKGIITYNFVLK